MPIRVIRLLVTSLVLAACGADAGSAVRPREHERHARPAARAPLAPERCVEASPGAAQAADACGAELAVMVAPREDELACGPAP